MSKQQTDTQNQYENTPVDGYYSDEDLGFDDDELDLSFLDEDEEDDELG